MATTAANAEAPGLGAPLDVVFDRLRGRIREQSPALFAVLNGIRLAERQPGRLSFEAPNAFSKQRIEGRTPEIEAICEAFFGEATQVAVSEATSAVRRERPKREDSRRLRQEALNHPLVNSALEILEADIVEIRQLGAAPRGPE